jgi:hypothetical protein
MLNQWYRACHQHGLAFDGCAQQCFIRRDFIAPEKIANINFLNLCNIGLAYNQVTEAGHGANMNTDEQNDVSGSKSTSHNMKG